MSNKKCKHMLHLVQKEPAKHIGDYLILPHYEWECKNCGASIYQVYAEKTIEGRDNNSIIKKTIRYFKGKLEQKHE